MTETKLDLEFLDKCREVCEKMPALTDEQGRFYIDLPASATPEAIAMFEANGFKVIPKPIQPSVDGDTRTWYRL